MSYTTTVIAAAVLALAAVVSPPATEVRSEEPIPIPSVQELTVEQKIRITFPDAPIMLEIAKAESRLIPTAKNPNSTASGVFQILKGTFEDPYYGCTGDVFDEADNIACARKIYDKSGTVPWDASRHVWGKEIPAST